MKNLNRIASLASLALLASLASPHAVAPNFPEPKSLNFKIPKAEIFDLSNGAKVFFYENHELPQIHLSIRFRGGTLYDPAQKIGLSGIWSAVLPHGGVKGIKADALTREMELMGSNISAEAGFETRAISCYSLTRNFERTIELYSKAVLNPSFNSKKVDVEKKKSIGYIARRNDSPGSIVGREFRRMVYGPQSPWGRRAEVKTISKISKKDLQKLHSERIYPKGAYIAVSGDITREKITELLEQHLGEKVWKGEAKSLPAIEAVNPETKRLVYFVDKSNIQQSSVILGHFSVKRHDPDYYGLVVMNHILGVSFTSRLFKNVRSRQGLAYTVRSAFSDRLDYGLMIASVGTKTESTVKATEAVLSVISSMQTKAPTKEEMETAKGQLINSFFENFSTPNQIVTNQMGLAFDGYPDNWLDVYQEKIASITDKEVVRIAKKYLKPQDSVILVVGNGAKFDKPLKQFGKVKKLDPVSGSVSESAKQPSKK